MPDEYLLPATDLSWWRRRFRLRSSNFAARFSTLARHWRRVVSFRKKRLFFAFQRKICHSSVTWLTKLE